jgi:phospholipid/cholesterol/gamma-HCH transport system substrate-binding protein
MVMNERVMQFRIGMFVIVAGLVLTMMIVWFGESPSLLRDHVYLKVRYDEAPGVAEGIPVRKSGIRIGEVSAISFDDRLNVPDGVIVTLSLERKYKIKAGSVPRVTRSLMGDPSIDLMPAIGPGLIATSDSAATAPVIEGDVAPDPSKALAAATQAFEKVGTTLKSIDAAANGITEVTKSADRLNNFLTTWNSTGQRVSAAADGIDRFIKANETDFQPAVTNLREVSAKLNATLDAKTQDALKTAVSQFSMASSKLNNGLDEARPLFKDLGAPVNSVPKTDFGQTIRRLNLITADVSLLTQSLRGPNGKLNTDGSLQKMITHPELYDNMNRFATSGNTAFEGFRPIIASLKTFADKIARDPSSLAKGALAR